MPPLLALHGKTLNGTLMRQQLGWLETRGVELITPDAPNVTRPELVERLYEIWDQPRPAPPHLEWWEPSEDFRTYRGWEATRELIVPILERGPVGIIGFSQGAILATALAALAQYGQVPPVSFVILIAGRTPRADVITQHLSEPIRIPSLHIWGEADTLMGAASKDQVERYDPTMRLVVTWEGGHSIPSEGPAADAIRRMTGAV